MFILFTEETESFFFVNYNNPASNKCFMSKNLNVKIGSVSMIVHELNYPILTDIIHFKNSISIDMHY